MNNITITPHKTKGDLILPSFFRLSDPNDKRLFVQLINQNPHVKIYDQIESQLRELMKIRAPEKKFSAPELAAAAHAYLNGVDPENYGVWVYYPWSGNMVHLLDEEEFIELRTSRNLFKITPEEEAILAQKKVGVIGMSVGQSVAVTMAIERSFGEIRIADFDSIELSNLNRIRAGVHNLGVPKVVITAREIAEIDPFLKVTIFPEGITEDNIDEFITKNGKLDIIVDECDGVEIKVLCREKAREYHIPVLMEASDRATIDIERFDIDPNRPIFHGKVPGLTYSFIKEKPKEEVLPYIFSIAGYETLSERMKYSLTQIGQTITTWPQLASAVVLGGGISADICRRIFTGNLQVSGRFFIDLEELISDK